MVRTYDFFFFFNSSNKTATGCTWDTQPYQHKFRSSVHPAYMSCFIWFGKITCHWLGLKHWIFISLPSPLGGTMQEDDLPWHWLSSCFSDPMYVTFIFPLRWFPSPTSSNFRRICPRWETVNRESYSGGVSNMEICGDSLLTIGEGMTRHPQGWFSFLDRVWATGLRKKERTGAQVSHSVSLSSMPHYSHSQVLAGLRVSIRNAALAQVPPLTRRVGKKKSNSLGRKKWITK